MLTYSPRASCLVPSSSAKSFAWLSPILVLALSCLILHSAIADGYGPAVYSGGSHTSQGTGSTPDAPFTGGYGGGDSWTGYPTAALVQSSGGITATFTWSGTSAPPKFVTVEQTCVATWQGAGNTAPTGSSSNGLGDPMVSSPPNPHEANGVSGLDMNGNPIQHYITLPGAAVLTVPVCSATANCSIPYQGGGSADVSYTALIPAMPVTIDPGGATPDGNGGFDILVGLQCCTTLLGLPPTYNLSNFQWSVTGTTMQSWTANNTSTTEVDGPGPLNISDPEWYWNDLIVSGHSKTETISCSATVTPPAGQGSSFTASVSQPVTVWMPVWTAKGYGGDMIVSSTSPFGHGSDYWLYAAPSNGSGQFGGMTFYAGVSPPPTPLVSQDAGNIYLVQLITPGRGYRNTAQQGYVSSDEGQLGLDTFWPYPWVDYEDPGYVPYYMLYDEPGIDLSSVQAIWGFVSDSFVDYIMYTPPGETNVYVPLGTFTWNPDGQASIPSTNNWVNFLNPAGSVTPSGSSVQFTPQNKYPSWTQNSGSTTYVRVQ